MTNQDDIRSRAVELIINQLMAAGASEGMSEDTEIVSSGILDSFGIMNLIVELELTLDIKFDPVDLASAESRTIGGLAQLAADSAGN